MVFPPFWYTKTQSGTDSSMSGECFECSCSSETGDRWYRHGAGTAKIIDRSPTRYHQSPCSLAAWMVFYGPTLRGPRLVQEGVKPDITTHFRLVYVNATSKVWDETVGTRRPQAEKSVSSRTRKCGSDSATSMTLETFLVFRRRGTPTGSQRLAEIHSVKDLAHDLRFYR